MKRLELAFYAVVRGLIVAFSRIWWRATFEGREHIPPAGPFVLAPVHRSFIDFGLVSGVTRRRMRYMGKEELWHNRWLGRFIGALGAFPVHRGAADRDALHKAVEVLEQGEPLVLFPEGTRRSGPVIGHLYEGAAYVAARTGVPVVPVGIGGSEQALPKGARLPRRVKVHLVVGRPLQPPTAVNGRVSRRTVRQLTEQLHGELQRLFDEARARAGASD